MYDSHVTNLPGEKFDTITNETSAETSMSEINFQASDAFANTTSLKIKISE